MSDQSYAGRPEAPTTAAGEPQSEVSRRSVLRGAGAGAAGLAAAAVVGTAGPALAAAKPASSRRHEAGTATHDATTAQSVVVHVRDARSGEMDVFAGTSHTRLRDPDLAARLARAVR